MSKQFTYDVFKWSDRGWIGNAIALPYLMVMFAASLAIKARVMVDLGTCTGNSAEVFAEVAELTSGIVYTVDIHNSEEHENFRKAREKLAGKKVIFIKGDSIEVGKAWDKGDIDVLFCDTDHSYERVYGELEVWGRYNPKIIFIHDTLGFEGNTDAPYNASKDYAEKNGKKFLNLIFPHGLGIIW